MIIDIINLDWILIKSIIDITKNVNFTYKIETSTPNNIEVQELQRWIHLKISRLEIQWKILNLNI